MSIISSINDFYKLRLRHFLADKARDKFYREQLELPDMQDNEDEHRYEFRKKLAFPLQVLFTTIGMVREDLYRRIGRPRYNLYLSLPDKAQGLINVLYYKFSLFDTYFLCQFHCVEDRIKFISIKTNDPIPPHLVNKTLCLLNRKFLSLKEEIDPEREVTLYGKLRMLDAGDNEIEISNEEFFRLNITEKRESERLNQEDPEKKMAI